jgi:hypothetical protein
MSLIDKRSIGYHDKQIVNILKQLKYKNNQIQINGSITYKQLLFFGDIDLFTEIKKTSTNTAQTIFKEFKRILEIIDNDPNLYLLEIKLQTIDKPKIKKYSIHHLTIQDITNIFSKLDFIKLDLVLYIDYRFVEVSCIYKFSNHYPDYDQSLHDDIKEYLKEQNYFKVLKRIFNLATIDENYELLFKLITFFNSRVGYQYAIYCNLEAIERLQHFYNDRITTNRIINNLKTLGLDSNIDKAIKLKEALYKTINKSSKSLYDQLV